MKLIRFTWCRLRCFWVAGGSNVILEMTVNNQQKEKPTYMYILEVNHVTSCSPGSIPEEDDGKLYNSCTVYGPDGELILKHRKIHLFDIDVPGKIRFQESETLTPGNSLSMFETPFCKVGVGICYDMRFAELAQLYSRKGCQLLVYPGAFNMTTGPAHWELLQRGRAIDNQVYVATASPARDESASYVAWGHSTVVNPWGEVISKAGAEEAVIYADIDLQYLADIRQQIPITVQRRDDLYTVTSVQEASS
ncbi:hypothetical protein PAMP_024803 [Pampus punctatissimus]